MKKVKYNFKKIIMEFGMEPPMDPPEPAWEWPEHDDPIYNKIWPDIDFNKMSDEEYSNFLDDPQRQQEFEAHHEPDWDLMNKEREL